MIHTCYIMTQVNVHNISNRLGAKSQMDLQLWTNWCVEAEGLGFSTAQRGGPKQNMGREQKCNAGPYSKSMFIFNNNFTTVTPTTICVN